jgi:hypothetical protein
MCGCQQATTMQGVDGGECDQVFAVTWPGDVDRLKARVGLVVKATDAGVKLCAALPQADRDAWNAFLAEWTPFAARPTPWIGSYNEWSTACSYSHMVDAWIVKLAGQCGALPGPGPVHGAETAGADTIKWIAIAAATLAAVGGAVYVAKMFR